MVNTIVAVLMNAFCVIHVLAVKLMQSLCMCIRSGCI